MQESPSPTKVSPLISGGPGVSKSAGPMGHTTGPDLGKSTRGPLGRDLALVAPSVRTSTTASKTPLEKAVLQAIQLGWLSAFEDAAQKYDFSRELLMAICYRESRLNPIYLKSPGDNGNAYGIMQIDVRYFGDWVKSGKWHDASECVDMGASVLGTKRQEIVGLQNKKTRVYSGKSNKWYDFEGKPISGSDLTRVAVADYNAGLWGYYCYSTGDDVDRYTTGADYSRWVLLVSDRIKQILSSQQGSQQKGPFDSIAEFA